MLPGISDLLNFLGGAREKNTFGRRLWLNRRYFAARRLVADESGHTAVTNIAHGGLCALAAVVMTRIAYFLPV